MQKVEVDDVEDIDNVDRARHATRLVVVSYLVLQPVGTMLTTYISTFANTIETDLATSATMLGMMQSVPLLLCFPATVLGSPLCDICGSGRAMALLGTALFLAAILTLVGYQIQSSPVMLLGQCIAVPANFLLDICDCVFLKTRLDSRLYSSLNGWACLLGAAGLLLNQFVLTHAPQAIVLGTSLLGAALVMTGGCLSACFLPKPEKCFTQETSGSACTRVCITVSDKFGLKALRALPCQTWWMIVLASVNSGIRGFLAYAPYGLQKVRNYTEIEANQLVAVASVQMALVSPISGRLFGSCERLRGPLFVLGAVILVAAAFVSDLYDYSWLSECVEYAMVGIGWTILKTGSVGLLPETLDGKDHLVSTGISLMVSIGLLVRMLFIQVLFSMGIDMLVVDKVFEFTHPKMFAGMVSFTLLIIAARISCSFSAKAPSESDVSQAHGGQ